MHSSAILFPIETVKQAALDRIQNVISLFQPRDVSAKMAANGIRTYAYFTFCGKKLLLNSEKFFKRLKRVKFL